MRSVRLCLILIHTIAHPSDRPDVIRTQLAAQILDMAVNHAVVTQIVVIPDAANEHWVGHHAPLILQQLPQAFELAVGQLQHLVAAHDGIGVQV